MNVLLINLILTTSEQGVIKRRASIKDCMICNFARGFIAAGHRVTIAAAEDFRPLHDEEADYEVVYFKSRFPRLFKPDLLPYPIGLKAYLKQHIDEFDLVVTSEAFSMGTLIARKICGDKLVIWQEMSLHQRKFFGIPSRLWYNLIVRFGLRRTLVVPRSEPARRFISRYASRVSEEIVDHGANAQVLYPSEEVDDTFIVVTRLSPLKHIDEVIEIFSRFVSKVEYAHFKLHIVGDGPEMDALQAMTSRLSVSDNVVFHGFLTHEKMGHLLRRSRAMLIRTSQDLNMISIPESIISGTPLVMNTVPNSASFVERNRLGIVNDAWDEHDLARSVSDYEAFHQACVDIRDELTNVGCARKMVQIVNELTR